MSGVLLVGVVTLLILYRWLDQQEGQLRSAGVSVLTPVPTVQQTGRATATPTATPTPTALIPSPTLPTPRPDPVAQRVDQLLSRMTLEEKVGQLFLVFFVGPDLSPSLQELVAQYHVGGILLFSSTDNVQSMPQVAQLINQVQGEAVSHGAGIPLFVALDQEGGSVVRLARGATVFPSNMALGATRSIDNARLMAQVTATELKALGINMNLAPVVDVNNNPDNPVIGTRSFGSSPQQVADLGAAMIETYKANGIIATAKHFPGHGDTATDSHLALPVIPHRIERLEATELLPFRAAIRAGVDAIMTAHVLVPAVDPSPALPATLSSDVLQGLLRDRLRYQGLITTDSLGMRAIGQAYGVPEAAGMAFLAGADLLALGADPGHMPAEQRSACQHVLSLVESDPLLESRLNESIRRILLVKARYGLLDWEPAHVGEPALQIGTDDHDRIARHIAQESITLVRNHAGTLPLAADQLLLAVVPPGAAGFGGNLQAYHPHTHVLQLSLNPSPEEIERVVRAAEGASVVVVGTVNARRHPGQLDLVRALADQPLVVAALDTPYDLMSFPGISAYLASYGRVPVSLDALARVIVGLEKPRGHLPVALPGLYPLGHGMHDFVSETAVSSD
ncbi:MAG: hypothetical protein ISS56_00245 [Anaerolineae bacterium]|nr:hypothetical protein [Anaerolineae bacterium]